MRRDMKSLDLHDSGSAALPHACRDPTQNSPARLHLFQEGGRGEMPPPPVPAWPDCRPPCPMQLLPPLLPFSFQALIYGCLCLWLSNRGGEGRGGGNSAGCEEDWGSSVPLSLSLRLSHTHINLNSCMGLQRSQLLGGHSTPIQLCVCVCDCMFAECLLLSPCLDTYLVLNPHPAPRHQTGCFLLPCLLPCSSEAPLRTDFLFYIIPLKGGFTL